MNQQMEECIEMCQKCHNTCLGEAMNHCLETGGEHVEPSHFRLMINCAEICQTSANFMLSGSPHHKLTCSVCAQVCEKCAESCEEVGGMEKCVEVCKHCAQKCQQMAA